MAVLTGKGCFGGNHDGRAINRRAVSICPGGADDRQRDSIDESGENYQILPKGIDHAYRLLKAHTSSEMVIMQLLFDTLTDIYEEDDNDN